MISVSFKGLASVSATQGAPAFSDACNRRINAELLCQAWLSQHDSQALAQGYQELVGYAQADALGKACIYRALFQLGRAQAQRGHCRQWWRSLDVQFAEGKEAWGAVSRRMQAADEVTSLTASLKRSQQSLKEAKQQRVQLRATIEALLTHICGEAALKREIQNLVQSVAALQEQNAALRRALAPQASTQGVAQAPWGLKAPRTMDATAAAPATVRTPPAFDARLLADTLSVDAPPSYPSTPDGHKSAQLAD